MARKKSTFSVGCFIEWRGSVWRVETAANCFELVGKRPIVCERKFVRNPGDRLTLKKGELVQAVGNVYKLNQKMNITYVR